VPSLFRGVPETFRRAALEAHRRAGAPILSFLLPTDCFACGRALGRLQRLGACLDCWALLEPPPPPLCRSCGLPVPRDTDLLGAARGACFACAVRRPAHDGVVAAVLYEGHARRFLLRAKFEDRPELLAVLGAQLAAALPSGPPACSWIVPVPSHPLALLRRGFNPALLLAGPVSRRLGVPLRPGLLSRTLRSLAPVKRLGARERAGALRGAFRSPPLRGRPRILVVDDVMTTGATADACAAVLRSAGAGEVRIAVWGRTPRGGGGF
jgi:predicted amidophosphoribosyltransferase